MMPTVATINFSGHLMVRSGDLWVSRAPFTNIDWQGNAARLQANHQRYGALVETRVGDEVRHALHYFSTLETLRDTFGQDRIGKDFGGRGVVANDDFSVAAFEFFLLKELGMDLLKHPVTDVTQLHAQAMCLVIGADLMADDQYLKIVKGPKGKREHATPNGKLYGPKGEEYVVSSLKKERTGTVDVDDATFPTDPLSGTRHYTGNVAKWMKRNPKEKYSLGFRGGSWDCDGPENFAASYRKALFHPTLYSDGIGFLAAAPAQVQNSNSM